MPKIQDLFIIKDSVEIFFNFLFLDLFLMIFQKKPSEVGPEVVQPGPELVHSNISSTDYHGM